MRIKILFMVSNNRAWLPSLPRIYYCLIIHTQFIPTIEVSGYFGFEDSPAIPQVSNRWRRLLRLKFVSTYLIQIPSQDAPPAGVMPLRGSHLQECNTLTRTLLNDNGELYALRLPDGLLCQSRVLNNTRVVILSTQTLSIRSTEMPTKSTNQWLTRLAIQLFPPRLIVPSQTGIRREASSSVRHYHHPIFQGSNLGRSSAV